jgi:hypothetical protein
MSFLEKLKQMVKVDINISTNININSNNISTKTEYDGATNTLSLNIAKFSDEEIRYLGTTTKLAVLEEGELLLGKDSEEIVESIKMIDNSPDVKSLLNFFKDKIPQEDWNALRAAMFIRKRFEMGLSSFDDTYARKGDVIKKYGTHGKNICNLCTSGYFETMLIPLHAEMKKMPDYSADKFLKIFNLIIDEEAFAIFVPGNMSTDEVKTTVEDKIRRNLRYGVNYVSIHGIGKWNVEKIKEAITDILLEHPTSKKNITESDNIINARLWF